MTDEHDAAFLPQRDYASDKKTMTEDDGFTLEAASQCGFEPTNDDANEYACNEAAVLLFARVCVRKGMALALECLNVDAIRECVIEIDAEVAPLLEAERVRWLATHDRNGQRLPVSDDPVLVEQGVVR